MCIQPGFQPGQGSSIRSPVHGLMEGLSRRMLDISAHSKRSGDTKAAAFFPVDRQIKSCDCLLAAVCIETKEETQSSSMS